MDLLERTKNENRHPWELSRTRSLIRIARDVLPRKRTILIADIGAGDRYFDIRLIERLIADNIDTIIYAVDNKYNDSDSKQKDIVLHQDVAMLEDNSMDCIIMMDVLEHIQEDSTFLKSVLEKLKENGILIVTVPAFQHLFSSHDTYLKHLRRYNYRQLHDLLQKNGLQIFKSHYFYSSLYLIRWLQVKFEQNNKAEEKHGIGTWKYTENSFVTKSLESVLNADFFINAMLNKIGIRLPGLSLLAVAVKK